MPFSNGIWWKNIPIHPSWSIANYSRRLRCVECTLVLFSIVNNGFVFFIFFALSLYFIRIYSSTFHSSSPSFSVYFIDTYLLSLLETNNLRCDASLKIVGFYNFITVWMVDGTGRQFNRITPHDGWWCTTRPTVVYTFNFKCLCAALKWASNTLASVYATLNFILSTSSSSV